MEKLWLSMRSITESCQSDGCEIWALILLRCCWQGLDGQKREREMWGECLPEPWKGSPGVKLLTERTELGLSGVGTAPGEILGSKDKGALCVQLKRNLKVYSFTL